MDHEIAENEQRLILQRFFELPRRDQLAAFDVMREYLLAEGERGEEAQSKRDAALDEQQAALEAMRLVADELGLPEGKSPTSTQFDRVAPHVASGWSTSRVVRTYGRWRFARDDFEGAGARPTARRLGIVRTSTRGRTDADYVAALVTWLDSSPPVESEPAYESFRDIYNDSLPADKKPLPAFTTIRICLKLKFDEALRVAKGEISLDNAEKHAPARRTLVVEEGPHGLIGAKTCAEICGRSARGRTDVVHRVGFPLPALVVGKLRLWRRDDVERFAAGKEIPDRPYNHLRGEYLTVCEFADMLQTRRQTVGRLPGSPNPAVQAAGQRFYLRTEVEAALPVIKEALDPRRRQRRGSDRRVSSL